MDIRYKLFSVDVNELIISAKEVIFFVGVS